MAAVEVEAEDTVAVVVEAEDMVEEEGTVVVEVVEGRMGAEDMVAAAEATAGDLHTPIPGPSSCIQKYFFSF